MSAEARWAGVIGTSHARGGGGGRGVCVGAGRVAVASISVEASFFELGGNSLRAVALARRLSSSLGREVSVADVLQRRRRRRSRWMGRWRRRGQRARAARARARALDGARLLATPHAVSWNQSQLLTVHVADGATAAYNIPMTHWLSTRGAV